MANIDIEKNWQIKDEISHILDRSSAWIGSKSLEFVDYIFYQPTAGKMHRYENVAFNAGLLKIIDEIISNSVDESRRKTALFPITQLDIDIKSDGKCIIRDNGGIPVVKHKGAGMLLPQMIFGLLRTSSNYDDTKERDWVGTNGLGAKLTNVFSKNFTVHTADGKNEVKIDWSDNMRECSVGEVKPTKQHFTEISFEIDLERFGVNNLDVGMCRILHKRAMDAAATNPHLTVNYRCDVGDGKLDSTWNFRKFKDYAKLFLPNDWLQDSDDKIFEQNSLKESIIITPFIGYDFGFVNGAICSKGTHFLKVRKQLCKVILEQCKKEDLELITERDINNHLSIFINCSIPNPEYDSQTKEKLSSKIKSDKLNLSQSFLKDIVNSPIMEDIREFYSSKYAKERAKTLRKLNNLVKNARIKKLVKAVGKSQDQEFWLFEGDSAGNGFRSKRNPLYQSAYFLRGKIKNTWNLSIEQSLENKELLEVASILKLQFGNPKQNLKNIPFKKVIIASDMDFDGNHIFGLLIAFIAKFFPELIQNGLLYRALSPLVVCTKNNGEKDYYYNMEEYEADYASGKISKRTHKRIIYCKGLGSLEDTDYNEMLHNQKLLKVTFKDVKEDIKFLDIWFSKAAEQRKEIISDENSDND